MCQIKGPLVEDTTMGERVKKQLEVTIGSMFKATSLSATIDHETGRLMDIHDKLVNQMQFLSK